MSGAIASMQCPQCGASLDVPSTAERATCTYCGSQLRVTRDAQGRRSAALTDIREDTDILARGMAIRHLKERSEELLQERQGLDEQAVSEVPTGLMKEPDSDANDVAAKLVGWGGLATLASLWMKDLQCAGLSLIPVALGILLFAAPFWTATQARRALEDAREKYRPAREALDEKIASTQKRLDELKDDMDRLTEEL